MSSRLLNTVALAALSFGVAGAGLAQDQAPAYRPAIAMFDGKNSAVFPASPSLDVSSVATIEMWVAPKWTGQLGYDPFLVTYMGDQGARFAVAMSGDKKAIGILAGDASDYAEFDFSDGKAHHVAFVFVQDTADVYVDGAFVNTLSISIADLPATQFVLGSANGTDFAFKGGLGDVRVWNAALDQAAIAGWRFKNAMSDGVSHPAADDLAGHSTFADGQRGFNVAEPDLAQDEIALVEAALNGDDLPEIPKAEDAQ